MEKDQEIRLHNEKWKRWNEQRKQQQNKKKVQIQQGLENYAIKLIQKLGDPSQEQQNKANKIIGSEIQTNVCGICLQLMVPPHHPMILFPCGHNFCKFCLFTDGHLKKQKYNLKLINCPVCRVKIQSYALNRNLMTLICTYTDNKHLIEKEMQEQLENQKGNQNIEKIRIRCRILENQQESLQKQIKKFKKEAIVLEQVIQTLKVQKKRNQRQIEKLEEEGRLINKHLNDKIGQSDNYQRKLKQLEDKQRIISKTLAPLLMQKEKMQFLEIARLMEKN